MQSNGCPKKYIFIVFYFSFLVQFDFKGDDSKTFAMTNVLNLLVIIIITSSAQAAPEESMENTFNCYADYLKRHGILDQKFPSEPFNGETYLCEVLLSTTVETVYTTLLQEFKKNDELKDAAACIVQNLQKLRWSDFDIKEKVFEVSDSITEEEKKRNISEIKAVQEKLSGEAVVSCFAEIEFGDLFDQIFIKDDQEDFVGDYCARTFALEKNLIDVSKYQVNKNPNSLNTKDIKCDAIIKKHFDEAEEELRQHLLKDSNEKADKVDCLISKYHENNFLNKTLAVALLGELEISDDQKQIEKGLFIQSMIKITSDLSACL